MIGLFLVAKGFIVAFAVAQLSWTEEDAARVLRLLLGAATIVLAAAVPDLIAPEAFRGALGFGTTVEYRNGLPSVVSLYGHPSVYAWFMASAALIALARALVAAPLETRKRALLWFAAFVVGAAISLRRKPVLGILAAAAFIVPTLGPRVSRRTVLAVGGVLTALAVPILALFFPILVDGAAEYVSVEALTGTARTALYAGSYVLAREHFPFGSGVGTYGSYGSVVSYSPIYFRFGFNAIYGLSPKYDRYIQDTFWPQILGEAGVLGFVGYAGAMAVLFAAAWRAARTITGPHGQVLAIAALLIAVETFIESFAAPTYGNPLVGCVSIGLLAMAARLAQEPAAAGSLAGAAPAPASTSQTTAIPAFADRAVPTDPC